MFQNLLFLTLFSSVTIGGTLYITNKGESLIDNKNYWFLVRNINNTDTDLVDNDLGVGIIDNSTQDFPNLYENNYKNYRCQIFGGKFAQYDNYCEIFKLNDKKSDNASDVIDMKQLNDLNGDIKPLIEKINIKKDNYYLLKLNRYLFNSINNETVVRLVNYADYPNKKTIGTFKFEGDLFITKQNKFKFNENNKASLYLIKSTESDPVYIYPQTRCKIGDKFNECDIYKFDDSSKPKANDKIANLNIKNAILTQKIENNNYYLIQLTKTRQMQADSTITIKYKNFNIISKIYGQMNKTNINHNGQFVFITDLEALT